MIELAEKSLCSGCAACAQSCAVGAIAMDYDEEGFIFPRIDASKCVSCLKCAEACPVLKSPKRTVPISVYAMKAKDERLVESGTSGGVFSLLAGRIKNSGGVVYGAGYTEDFSVVHKRAESEEELAQLRGSKYVQSETGETFRKVKEDLKDGRKVLFAGTPCQCAGLKGYLKKEHENLYCVSLVCHGVPSVKLYRKYLSFISKGKEISKINFRDKASKDRRQHIRIDFTDGSFYRKYTPEDPYMLAFIQNISLRKSCSSCRFKNFSSLCDITLGDFWGIEDTDSVFALEKDVSMVAVNSRKGEMLVEGILGDVRYDRRSLKEALPKNQAITASVKKNPLREKYLRDMKKLHMVKLTEKYLGSGIMAKLRRNIHKFGKDR